MLCVNFWNLEPNVHLSGIGLETVLGAGEAAQFIENWRRKGWLTCVAKDIWRTTEPERLQCSTAELCAALSAFGIALTENDFQDDVRLNLLMGAPFAGRVEWMFLDCYYTVSELQTRGLHGSAPSAVDASPVGTTLNSVSFILKRAP